MKGCSGSSGRSGAVPVGRRLIGGEPSGHRLRPRVRPGILRFGIANEGTAFKVLGTSQNESLAITRLGIDDCQCAIRKGIDDGLPVKF